MSATILVKEVFHVFEEFYMPTLVAGNSDTLCIFFNSTFYNIGHTTVMPQVNDLCALGL